LNLWVELPSFPGPCENGNGTHHFKMWICIKNSGPSKNKKSFEHNGSNCRNVILIKKLFQAQYMGARREYIGFTPH
jgi:hypothetical protein